MLMLIPIYKCPVPFSQQPLNEFNSLKNSCFFSWLIKSNKLLFKFMFIWFIGSIFSSPIIYNFFPIFYNPWKFLVSVAATANCILILILMRLYLGWSYVVRRLLSATVFYEESGWYDGQVWIKPSTILIQDRLVGIYEALPLLVKVKKVLLIVSIILLFEFILYIFL